MPTASQCPRCAAPLHEDAPEGFCPRCIIGDLLEPGYADEVAAENGAAGVGVLRYFGDYEFLEPLSRGGMGAVFKARQVSLNRFVAVKMILGGAAGSSPLRKRFQVEAEAAARLQHPHIVPIYEFGEYAGEFFLSMKLIEGARSIAELRLPPRGAVDQLIQIAHAVHFAHQRGVLHRDIKPGNILVGEDGTAYLTDFGLAKLADHLAGVTATREILGTPAYMAPEQIAGAAQAVTTAADVYGLGATLYECLAGRPPFEAGSVPELLRKITEEEPAPLGSERNREARAPAVDRDLETICFKCLEKDPKRRYASSAALAEDLELWREGKPIRARPVSTIERVGKWARRKPAWAALYATASCALLAMAVGGSWFNLRLGQKNREAVERVIRLNINAGSRLEADSDPARAMLYLAEALRLAEANGRSAEVEMLRLRFDSLLRQSPRLLQLWVHEGGANDAEFSPDGARVLTAGNDGAARVWDARTGAPLFAPLRHGSAVQDAMFSPDGSIIATISASAEVRLWSAADGAALSRPFPTNPQSAVWEFGPRAWAFDSSGRFFAHALSNEVHLFDRSSGAWSRIATASGEALHLNFRPGTQELAVGTQTALEYWHLPTPVPLKIWPQAEGVRWVGFTPGGDRLLALVGARKLRVWETDPGRPHLLRAAPVASGEMHPEPTATITDVSFSPDGKLVAAVTFSDIVRLWDAATGGAAGTFSLPEPVKVIQFSAGRNCLATIGLDGVARFSDPNGFRIGPLLWHGGALVSADASPSGDRLVTACQDGSVRLWKLPALAGGSLGENQGWHRSLVEISGDGLTQASYSGGSAVHLTRSETNQHSVSIQLPGAIQFAALSRDGHSVAVISVAASAGTNLSVWNRDATLRFQWPAAEPDRRDVRHASFSPDGANLAVAFRRRGGTAAVQITDAATGEPRLPALEHAASVVFAEFDARGLRLATAAEDGTARVWEVKTGQPLSPPLKHAGSVSVARFSPDGESLVTACTDDSFLPLYAQVWSARSFSPRGGKLWHQDGVLDAVFSPDSQKVLTAGQDRFVRLWNAATGQPLTPPLPLAQKADQVAFSPDGRIFLVACRISFLQAFHTATGEPVTAPIRHGAYVARACFAPGSDALLFAGTNGFPSRIPLVATALSASQLRATAELLSNHRLSPQGLERLSMREFSEAWQSARKQGLSTGD